MIILALDIRGLTELAVLGDADVGLLDGDDVVCEIGSYAPSVSRYLRGVDYLFILRRQEGGTSLLELHQTVTAYA